MRVHVESESDRRSGGVVFATAVLVVALVAVSLVGSVGAQDEEKLPSVVSPGSPTQAPADAIVLFDGEDASAFTHHDGSEVKWTIVDGVLTIEPGSGSIRSVEEFGATQLHLEFASPSPAKGSGQGRGNSGVYLQGRYEVQVLDSYENDTYPDGQCGAVYGQYPPLVNVCRPPGEWQTYDILFHPPVFDEEGEKMENGTLTVLHNGVLIQDHVEILGATTAAMQGEGPEPGPLWLQDHHNPVRYRNIWIRPL